MEKRRQKRVPKRFNVRFGEGELAHSGFTRDLSAIGAFIATSHMPPLGCRVHIQMLVGTSRSVFFEGVVSRQHLVPPQMRQIDQMGFGVAFRSPTEVFEEIVPSTTNGNRFEVRFQDAQRLQEIWKQELRLGALFVRTDRHLVRDAEVHVALHLEFAKRDFEFIARVVQQVGVGPSAGIAVSFVEPAVVRNALGPFIGL
jgi:hypothetical protein